MSPRVHGLLESTPKRPRVRNTGAGAGLAVVHSVGVGSKQIAQSTKKEAHVCSGAVGEYDPMHTWQAWSYSQDGAFWSSLVLSYWAASRRLTEQRKRLSVQEFSLLRSEVGALRCRLVTLGPDSRDLASRCICFKHLTSPEGLASQPVQPEIHDVQNRCQAPGTVHHCPSPPSKIGSRTTYV